jgi:hypothetical protein
MHLSVLVLYKTDIAIIIIIIIIIIICVSILVFLHSVL